MDREREPFQEKKADEKTKQIYKSQRMADQIFLHLKHF